MKAVSYETVGIAVEHMQNTEMIARQVPQKESLAKLCKQIKGRVHQIGENELMATVLKSQYICTIIHTVGTVQSDGTQ